VHQNVYRLHAIILSRSPYLAHLMSTSPQTSGQRVIYVRAEEEPEVDQEVRLSEFLNGGKYAYLAPCTKGFAIGDYSPG